MKKVITSGGLVIKGDSILLVKKGSGLAIPKGHVEEHETLEDTAIREVREETGRKVLIIKKLGQLTRQSTEDSGDRVRKVIHLYLMQPEQAISGQADEDSVWVRIKDAPEMMEYEEERDFLIRHATELTIT